MQFGINWLQDYLSNRADLNILKEELPLIGFEVESLTKVAEPFDNVVVAQIISANQHPNADRLKLCKVTDGTEEYNIVCGAPNARAGIIVALAKVGAVLPGKIKIKRSKIRGEESLGMLCSGAELGLSLDEDGIIELADCTKLGTNIRDALQLDEYIIDIDITPNRGDCLSVRGISREIALITNSTFSEKTIPSVSIEIETKVNITTTSESACPRYLGRVIKIGKKGQKSPKWIEQRITRAGLRPINLIVDITNLVMLDIGQPLHAFDYKKISGTINVRQGKEGEKLSLLNDQNIELDTDKLVISDDSGAIALAGIMGGKSTEIDDTSEYIFLEAAHFSQKSIAGRARKYGLHTDASMRFERGVDYNLPIVAIEMASKLLIDYAEAKLGPITEANNQDKLPKESAIACDINRFNQLSGITLDTEKSLNDLKAIGFTVTKTENSNFNAVAPSWRYDIKRHQDILEEILRIYGLTNIPNSLPSFSKPSSFGSDLEPNINLYTNHLVGLGYQEVVSYSFIDKKSQQHFIKDTEESIKLANPISSDLSHMRASLIPSLLKTLAYNLRRQHSNLQIFETGLSYQIENKDIVQKQVLAMAVTGLTKNNSWNQEKKPADFYYLKGDIISLLSLSIETSAISFIPQKYQGLHPGRSASIAINKDIIGYIGEVHPRVLSELGFGNNRPVVCQIYSNALTKYQRPEYKTISSFPKVNRDLALVVDQQVYWQQIKEVIEKTAGDDLIELYPFDVFQHESLGDNKKSIAIRFSWQSETKTLTDAYIKEKLDDILNSLSDKFLAKLRP